MLHANKSDFEVKSVTIVSVLIIIGFICFSMCVCIFFVAYDRVLRQREANWEAILSSPAEEYVVQAVCNRPKILASIAFCARPYWTVSNREIGSVFKSLITVDLTTFEEIEDIFGTKNRECDGPLKTKPYPYRCTYRYNWDTPAIHVLFNEESGIVEAVYNL